MTKVFPLSDKNKKLLPYCIDFRVLGYCPAEIDLCNKSLDSIVGAVDREPPTIKQEQMNGDRCWRLQWKSKKNVIYDVWICPARGSNVVRIDTTAEYAKGPTIRKTLRSKVVRVGKSDSWFPEHVIYEIRNGDKAVFSETLSISNVHINEDVFPGTFTLAGFDLEAGTGVHRVGEKPAIGAWNPKTSKVEPLPDIPEPEFIDAKSSGSGSAHWRIALASFALVGSIGLIILSRWCYLPRKPRDTRQTLFNKGDAEHVRQS